MINVYMIGASPLSGIFFECQFQLSLRIHIASHTSRSTGIMKLIHSGSNVHATHYWREASPAHREVGPRLTDSEVVWDRQRL